MVTASTADVVRELNWLVITISLVYITFAECTRVRAIQENSRIFRQGWDGSCWPLKTYKLTLLRY
jgi:hypothetical protein